MHVKIHFTKFPQKDRDRERVSLRHINTQLGKGGGGDRVGG